MVLFHDGTTIVWDGDGNFNVSKKGKACLNKVMDARDLCLLVSAIIPWGDCILSPEFESSLALIRWIIAYYQNRNVALR